MIGRHNGYLLPRLPLPTHASNTPRSLQERLSSEIAKGNDHPRIDSSELRAKEFEANHHLLGCGIAIPWRPAFDHVGDIDRVANREAHGRDHLIEQKTRAAHERSALGVFVGPRAFAYEYELRMRAAFAEYDFLPGFT